MEKAVQAAIYEKALKNHYIEILYIDFEDTHALCIWQYRCCLLYTSDAADEL